MTERHWRTEVYNRGERILTIEHACLSGRDPLTDDDKEVIRIAGENLLGFVGSPQWQPIATAPKVENEPVILGFITAAGEIRASSGRWTNHNGGGWARLMIYEPSHWMPMPAMPESFVPQQ